MGNLLSSLAGGSSNPALDDPDPATGLTQREKMAVRRTWDIVKADIKQNGIDLLVMYVSNSSSRFKTN
jgi:hypothetical protein